MQKSPYVKQSYRPMRLFRLLKTAKNPLKKYETPEKTVEMRLFFQKKKLTKWYQHGQDEDAN